MQWIKEVFKPSARKTLFYQTIASFKINKIKSWPYLTKSLARNVVLSIFSLNLLNLHLDY